MTVVVWYGIIIDIYLGNRIMMGYRRLVCIPDILELCILVLGFGVWYGVGWGGKDGSVLDVIIIMIARMVRFGDGRYIFSF